MSHTGFIRLYAALIVTMLSAIGAAAFDVRDYRFHQMQETSYYGGINSIAMDRFGRIWFSGTDALYMYNGHSFEPMSVPSTESRTPVDYRKVLVGKDKELYAATSLGLYEFDYSGRVFSAVACGNVGTAEIAADGDVWMVLNDKVTKCSQENHALQEFPLPVVTRVSPTSLSLACTQNHIWVGAWNRLFILSEDVGYSPFADVGENPDAVIADVLEMGEFVYVLTVADGIYVYDLFGGQTGRFILPSGYDKSSTAKQFCVDSHGIIWVATQSGLMLIGPDNSQTELLTSSLLDECSLPNNSVWSLYSDPDGGMWVGTYGGKLAYQTFHDSHVLHVGPSHGSLSHPIVSAFAEDYDGNLWIGTEGGGLCKWDHRTDKFSCWRQESAKGYALNSNMVKRLYPDGKDMVVAMFNGGLCRIDIASGRVENLNIQKNGRSVSVYDFASDYGKGYWLADPDVELKHWDRRSGETGDVKFYDAEGTKLRVRVETFFYDDQGKLWLVTHNGVKIMDPVARKLVGEYNIDRPEHSYNNLCCFCRTDNQGIWFGTRGAGVNVLTPDGEYMNINDNPDGTFEDRTVFGILEDNASGDVWMSTDAGLFVYDASDGIVEKSRIDILNKCGAYYVRSCFKTKSGEMLFGGTNGFIMFNPEKFHTNPYGPHVYFTSLKVNEEIVAIHGKDGILSQAIETLDGRSAKDIVRLKRNESNFEVGFSCDSYLESDRNTYAYRMVGAFDNWSVLPAGQRYVRFVNLPKGKYTLEVKAANNDGLWGEDVCSLTFKVRPYLMASTGAYCLYVLLILLVVWWVWRYSTRRKMLEQQLELEKEKERNLNALTKSRIDFFTNIAHDLKTPLTLMIDPLRQLSAQMPKDAPYYKYISMVVRNAGKTQHMISQLLKFRQIETAKLPPDNKPGDIVNFVGNIFSLFEFEASKRHIETEFSSWVDCFHTMFDYDMVEKIFTNLFSNAVKYASAWGFVNVTISVSKPEEIPAAGGADDVRWLTFAVTNSGQTIPESELPSIFEPFNRQGKVHAEFGTHTGLGLAIVKELVSDLNGVIKVNSDEQAVSFTVVLPFVQGNVGKTDDDESENNAYDYVNQEIDNMISDMDDLNDADRKRGGRQYDVLIIEDDSQLRNYMEMRLSKDYNVYSAINGRDGIAKIEKVMPNVIITDLLMPEMNGFEVCREVRSNIRISHIPIIALSAIGDNPDARIQALDAGANVFVDKPVDLDFLSRQVANLIGNQAKLKELYSRKFAAVPGKLTISSLDDEIMKKAVDLIEKNMEDEEYTVDRFVADMAIGRTKLYRKLDDLTGMSIKEFILDIRLKRAGQLLMDTDCNVAETAMKTGFGNPKYFSICFKRHFGLSPTEYKTRQCAGGENQTAEQK